MEISRSYWLIRANGFKICCKMGVTLGNVKKETVAALTQSRFIKRVLPLSERKISKGPPTIILQVYVGSARDLISRK